MIMKHKQNDNGLLTPTDYWEKKLGIEHRIEKARYKRLCGYKLSRNEKKLLDGAYYITFSDWKEYIDEKISVLDDKELLEYSKYINSQLQRQDVFNGLFSELVIPLMLAMLAPIFTELCTQYLSSSYDSLVFAFLSILLKYVFFVIALVVLLKVIVDNAQDNKANNLFYKDMYDNINLKLKKNSHN